MPVPNAVAIEVAARWLADNEPLDERLGGGIRTAQEIRDWRYHCLVDEMTRIARDAPPMHTLIGRALNGFVGDDMATASVRIQLDRGTVYGYLNWKERPSFIWPQAERERLMAKWTAEDRLAKTEA